MSKYTENYSYVRYVVTILLIHAHTHLSPLFLGWFNHLYTVSDVFYDPRVAEGGNTAQYCTQSHPSGCQHLSGLQGTTELTGEAGE